MKFRLEFDETNAHSGQPIYYCGISEPAVFDEWEEFLKKNRLYKERMVLDETNCSEKA